MRVTWTRQRSLQLVCLNCLPLSQKLTPPVTMEKNRFVNVCVCACACLSVCQSVSLSVCLTVCMCVCMCLCACLSVCVYVCGNNQVLLLCSWLDVCGQSLTLSPLLVCCVHRPRLREALSLRRYPSPTQRVKRPQSCRPSTSQFSRERLWH